MKIISRVVGFAVFAGLAYAIYPDGITDITFAKLTLGKCFVFVGSVSFGCLALKVLFFGFDEGALW